MTAFILVILLMGTYAVSAATIKSRFGEHCFQDGFCDSCLLETAPESGGGFYAFKRQEGKDKEQAVKAIYLTFDDGPSAVITPKVLDILKKHGVKATFFVVGNECERNPALLKRIAAEGHTVGAHCYAHDYKFIYSSVINFRSDLNRCLSVIKSIVPGYRVEYMRFPGGSFNLSKKYISAVSGMNLKFVDWNCINGDTDKSADTLDALNIAQETSALKNTAVMLMHDNKSVTANSLDSIIRHFKAKGYEFNQF